MEVEGDERIGTDVSIDCPAIMNVCIPREAFRGVHGQAVEVVDSEGGEARAVNSTDLEK